MKFITINGIELAYRDSLEEAGTGAGRPTLLFLHGAGGSLEQFAAQRDRFAGGYRAVSVSMRGHGASGAPDPATKEAYSLQAMGEDLALFIERLGLAPAHVVGNSAGGVMGLELAAKRPELLASLCVFGTVARMAFPKFLRDFTFWFDTKMAEGEGAERKLGALAKYVSKKPEVRSAVAGMFVQAARSIRFYRYALGAYDYLDVVRSLRLPFAIIRGGKDADINLGLGSTLRAVEEARAAGLPRRLFELHTAGHIANLDEPEAFNLVLEGWLGEVAGEAVGRSRDERRG